MGKVLRVLIVLILVLGAFAVYLAAVNFTKREVLIGRTHALEETFIKLARTIEADDPPEVPQPAYPQRDLSPVTSREVENPERSAFWDSYNHKFEPTVQPIPTLDFSSNEKRRQLREFYLIDPATGKPARDINGKPDTKGAGTMDELLSTVFDRAKSQYALLNQTRAELPKLRNELVDVVEDLNRQKQAGRADKRSLEEKDVQIATLGREKRELEDRNARLDEEMRGIRTELQEANDVIARNDDDIKLLTDTVAQRDKTIAELRGRQTITGLPVGDRLQDNGEGHYTPGVHGKIVSFNEEWKFAVIEFSDDFMAQLQGPDGQQPMPQLEMMVKRPGFAGVAGEFITRVRLRQIIRDQNLVVADILVDWQQAPLEFGDEVFF